MFSYNNNNKKNDAMTIVARKLTTLKKNIIDQLFLGITYCK